MVSPILVEFSADGSIHNIYINDGAVNELSVCLMVVVITFNWDQATAPFKLEHRTITVV